MQTIETGPIVDNLGLYNHTLAAIILKAKTFGAMVPESDPVEASNSSDDREIDILEDQSDNSSRETLEQAINGLTSEQQASLVALTWIGRGDFEPEEWEDVLQRAKERKDISTSHYLSSTPLFGDHLENGIAALGINVTEQKAAIMSHDQNPDPMHAQK